MVTRTFTMWAKKPVALLRPVKALTLSTYGVPLIVAILTGVIIALTTLNITITLTDWLNLHHKLVLHTHRRNCDHLVFLTA